MLVDFNYDQILFSLQVMEKPRSRKIGSGTSLCSGIEITTDQHYVGETYSA